MRGDSKLAAGPGAITKFGYSRAGPVFCPDFLTGPGRAARPAALIQTSKIENGVKIENAFEYETPPDTRAFGKEYI